MLGSSRRRSICSSGAKRPPNRPNLVGASTAGIVTSVLDGAEVGRGFAISCLGPSRETTRELSSAMRVGVRFSLRVLTHGAEPSRCRQGELTDTNMLVVYLVFKGKSLVPLLMDEQGAMDIASPEGQSSAGFIYLELCTLLPYLSARIILPAAVRNSNSFCLPAWNMFPRRVILFNSTPFAAHSSGCKRSSNHTTEDS